jgi:SAM-dependent methyltransferase
MSDGTLQQLYENPATPLSSGRGRADRQAAILARIASAADRPLRGVDIGCGDGMCTQVAVATCRATLNASVGIVGFDWSMAALRQAQLRDVPVARASADAGGLPLATSSVDFVIMSELIEHLVDPDATLDEARRVLVPGGTLLLSTPNLAAWYNRALLLFGVQPIFSEVSLRGIYGRPGKEVVGHLRLFTRRALKSSSLLPASSTWRSPERPTTMCRAPCVRSIVSCAVRRAWRRTCSRVRKKRCESPNYCSATVPASDDRLRSRRRRFHVATSRRPGTCTIQSHQLG